MKILVLLSFTILISYVVAVVWRWGLPWSVSRTFFDIKRKYIFTFVMFAAFGLLMMPLMEVLTDETAIFGFLTCAGGFIVGSAPNLSDKFENKVHMTGALTLAVASQVCVGVICPWLLLLWLGLSILLYLWRKHLVFWIEIFGGSLLYGAILIGL